MNGRIAYFLYLLLFIWGIAGVNGQSAKEHNQAEVVIDIFKVKPNEENYYKIFRPFMNSEKNLSTIMKAIDIYEKRLSGGKITEPRVISGEILGEEDADEEEEDTTNLTDDFGNTYLQSILFTSKDYWTVWVNNTKISNQTNSEEGTGGFFVKEINRDTVTLVRMFSKGEWKHVNAGGSIEKNSYETNKKTGRVELTIVLHPNQTFVALENKIIDGRYRKEVLEVDSSVVNNVEILLDNGEIDIDELLNNL